MKTIFVTLLTFSTITAKATETTCKGICYWYGQQDSIGIPIVDKVHVSLHKTENPYDDLIRECTRLNEKKYGSIDVRPALWVFPHPFSLIEFEQLSTSGHLKHYILAEQYLPQINPDSMCE